MDQPLVPAPRRRLVSGLPQEAWDEPGSWCVLMESEGDRLVSGPYPTFGAAASGIEPLLELHGQHWQAEARPLGAPLMAAEPT